MAGYFLYSLDADAFRQLTTKPTIEQGQIIARAVAEEVEGALGDYDGERAADRSRWPASVKALAVVIQQRLAADDWYVDFSMGDAAIWNGIILRSWEDEAGEEIGLDFECENDGDLQWAVARLAAERGASMLAEPDFGNAGFRHPGRSHTRLRLAYSLYMPSDVERLRDQLEQVAPHFESLPEKDKGLREVFFGGLIEPVRKVHAEGRVLWVQADT